MVMSFPCLAINALQVNGSAVVLGHCCPWLVFSVEPQRSECRRSRKRWWLCGMAGAQGRYMPAHLAEVCETGCQGIAP